VVEFVQRHPWVGAAHDVVALVNQDLAQGTLLWSLVIDHEQSRPGSMG